MHLPPFWAFKPVFARLLACVAAKQQFWRFRFVAAPQITGEPARIKGRRARIVGRLRESAIEDDPDSRTGIRKGRDARSAAAIGMNPGCRKNLSAVVVVAAG